MFPVDVDKLRVSFAEEQTNKYKCLNIISYILFLVIDELDFRYHDEIPLINHPYLFGRDDR
jgi:hypothetical protein